MSQQTINVGDTNVAEDKALMYRDYLRPATIKTYKDDPEDFCFICPKCESLNIDSLGKPVDIVRCDICGQIVIIPQVIQEEAPQPEGDDIQADLVKALKACRVSLIGDEDYYKHKDLLKTIEAALEKAEGVAR